MDNVIKLAVNNQAPTPRFCSDCRFNRGKKCAETDSFISNERAEFYDVVSRCGSEGRLRQPKPASFFERLGDAIISRITK